MSDTIALAERGLTLRIAGRDTYFNYYWLRDACTSCIDPQTRERRS